MDARCPQCAQTIRLPGKLAAVATIITRRQKNLLGIGLEAAGFVSMAFFFPWGMLVGAALVFVGWKKSRALLCSNCGARVRHPSVEKCPQCHSGFGVE